jgi:hypothetical protein
MHVVQDPTLIDRKGNFNVVTFDVNTHGAYVFMLTCNQLSTRLGHGWPAKHEQNKRKRPSV